MNKKEVKPEEVKPEEVKPEEVKPEEVKPEEVKPEEVKPEEVNPEEVKPERKTTIDEITEIVTNKFQGEIEKLKNENREKSDLIKQLLTGDSAVTEQKTHFETVIEKINEKRKNKYL